MTGMDDLEAAIDLLFAEPPEGFIKQRGELVARLKAEGNAEGAARVSALRRPVRSAWVINRLAHEDPAAVQELARAGERLRTAQRRAISSKDAGGLREASEERAKLIGLLTQRATAALGDDPPAAVTEEIASTLEAASTDEAAARQVLQGRLSKPLSRPAGFGDVSGLKLVSGSEDSPTATDDSADIAKHEREVRSAGRRERQARERAERLRAEVTALEERLAEGRERLRTADAEAQRAAADLKRLGRSER